MHKGEVSMSQNSSGKQTDKLLVFGSFTEDELRSLKGKSPVNAVDTSVKKGLQFGSLDIETVRALGCHNVGDAYESSKSVQRVVVSEKGGELDNGTKETEILQSSPVSVKENGTAYTSTGSFIPKEVKEIEGKTTSIVFEDERAPLNETAHSNSCGHDSLTSSDKNLHTIVNSFPDGIASDSAGLVNSKDGVHKALNGSGGKHLLPRGLINSGNLCFLNATLQALLSCSPFVQLMQELRIGTIPKFGYPTLHAFVEFISDFDMPADSSSKKNDAKFFQARHPLSPTMFEPILKMFTPDVPNSMSGRPRQEDAQEFLSFVMDHMHDELLKLQGHLPNLGEKKTSLISSSEDDGWETVGPRNRPTVVRTQSFAPSELSAIFGGQLRSVVKARGNKASATVQPFLLLHLDIYPDAVRTIEDALHLLSVPEKLEDYRASAAGKAGVVSASKSVQIQSLSKVMILHLMRFGYGSQGTTKLHKPVHFSLDLVLGRELLVSPSEGRRYKLVATVTHHGREPSKGHYTADCFNAEGQWLRYDDSSVTTVGVNKVLHDQAYVLFYKQE